MMKARLIAAFRALMGEGEFMPTAPTVAPTPNTPPAVAQAREQFRQWPPAPDEITPGIGGGTTPGISRDQLEVLVDLWLGCPHRPMIGVENVTAGAVAYIAGRFGWVDVARPEDLDPDQYYAARHWLREWVEKGNEPRWPGREKLGPTDSSMFGPGAETRRCAHCTAAFIAPARTNGANKWKDPWEFCETCRQYPHILGQSGNAG